MPWNHKNRKNPIKYKDELYFNSKENIKEEFRTIIYKEYGEITVNNLGTKVFTKTGKKPCLFIDGDNYLMFNAGTSHNCVRKNYAVRIHRLVALAFIENKDNLPEVNHIDGDKKNNCVTNLEWVSGKENIKKSFEIGLHPSAKGENNANSKLTKAQVEKIKELFSEGDFTRAELSRRFNVSWTMINFIVKNLNWNN